MKRREFAALIATIALIGYRAAIAQQHERMRRIGVLMLLSADER
jgi:hypothetical protein